MLAATTPDIKLFMNHLLTGTEFDRFLLCEATILTGSTYVIDGHINREFYDTDTNRLDINRNYQYWNECKSIVFQIIKGNRPPLALKIILMADAEQTISLVKQYNIPLTTEQISGLYLNIRYEHGQLNLSTGTAMTIFTLDKTLEHMWDEMLSQFLYQLGIALITA